MPAMAQAFGIRSLLVDGNDVISVAEAARILVDELRAGRGPAALECVTDRHRGHYEGDAQKYRDATEFETMKTTDAIAIAANALIRFGVPQKTIDAESDAALEKIDRAVTAALSADFPDIDTVSRLVYAETKSG
jgi:pyruvate dehydrogenase E1 component alpha subunit